MRAKINFSKIFRQGVNEVEMRLKVNAGISKTSCIALVLAAAVAVLAAAPAAWCQTTPVLKVNGVVLTERDLEESLNRIVPAMSFHGAMSKEKRDEYLPQAKQQMIDDELLYQEAERTGLKVDRKLIHEARKRTIKRLGGKKQYKAALKNAGLTDGEFRAKIRRRLMIDKIIELEVTSKSVVSDEEVRRYYEDNKGTFKRPESRRIRHILVSVKPNVTDEEREARRKRAEEALRKIRDGEDMAKVAWDYSDDPYRVKGGDLGLIHQGRLDPQLEAEVFKLGEGELSGVIETIYGYHIARVEEVREPELLGLQDVSQKIRNDLGKRKREELREALLSRLRASAAIEEY